MAVPRLGRLRLIAALCRAAWGRGSKQGLLAVGCTEAGAGCSAVGPPELYKAGPQCSRPHGDPYTARRALVRGARLVHQGRAWRRPPRTSAAPWQPAPATLRCVRPLSPGTRRTVGMAVRRPRSRP